MSSSPTPPRIARAVLQWSAPSVDREYLLADLDDEFAALAASANEATARRWYRRQVLRSIAPLVMQRATLRITRSPITSYNALKALPSPRMLTDLRADLRDAVRRTRRFPFVSATIVLSFALGIGATTAVYSVVRGVLLKPLAFAGSERVVRLETFDAKNPPDLPSETWTDFNAWKAQARSFERLAAHWEGGPSRVFKVADQTTTEPVAIVTQDFDEVMGARTLHGRLFRDDEFALDGTRVVLLGEQYWRRAFGGDSTIVGRTLEISDTARLVVGILADGTSDYPGSQLAAWIPLVPRPGSSFAGPRTRYLAMIGRMKPGITPDQANAELRLLVQNTSLDSLSRTRMTRVTPLAEKITASVRPVLWLLTGVVCVVLLVAAGNVALLLLSQAHARRRELAIRASLGSATFRLVRKLLVESLLMASIGGLAGVLIARGLTSLMLTFYPGRLARAGDIALDLPVLGVALLVTTVVALLSAAPLIRRVSLLDLIRDLREGASTHTRAAMRTRTVLAISQLAFAVCLVAGGGLLVRTFIKLSSVEPGFRADRVAYIPISASAVRYATAEELLLHLDAAEAAVRGIAGVEMAAAVNYIPLPSRIAGWGTQMVRTNDAGDTEFPIQYRQMTPGYLAVMSIPLKRGRSLLASDNSGSPPVAVINETLARAAFPNADPVGQLIKVQNKDWEVVGVIGDMRYWGLAKPVVGEVFVSPSQAFTPKSPTTFAFRTIVFKTAGSPNAVLALARAAIHRADPSISMGLSGTLTQRLTNATAPERFRAMLVGALGSIALLLAACGLYAVTAFGVFSRTREIGIRVALGATSAGVRRAVLINALRVGATGTAIGLGLAWYCTRGIERFLFGAAALDAPTVAVVGALFLAVSLLAAFVPARRASRVDPMRAMRAE